MINLLLFMGCFSAEERYEGEKPGDCQDKADNDKDGTFDCDDKGCMSSPDCKKDAVEIKKDSTQPPKKVQKPRLPTLDKPYVVQKKHAMYMERKAGMIFLGWSKDNSKYAFELHLTPDGGHDCDFGGYELQVVDATKDAWVPQSRILLSNTEGASGECTYATEEALRRAFEFKREKILKKTDIVKGNLSAPVSFQKSGDSYSFTAGEYTGVVKFTTEDNSVSMTDAGLGYFLSWDKPFRKSIEKGKKRNGIMVYNLSHAFPSPDLSHIAFVIEQDVQVYEGIEKSFMTNGSALQSN